ncbi:MAG: 50S ribosomal protein L24 [Clostridia bacterium]|nr:50S ribosomal protein L24 [Clostridia bacterium]
MSKRIHIKKGDQVLVISGDDKGKKGKVLSVIPSKGRVVVEGINMVTKHKKPRSQTDVGGIIHQEAPISATKVMHICDKCKKATPIGYMILEDGSKVRKCRKCNETFGD